MVDFFSSPADRALEEANAGVERAKAAAGSVVGVRPQAPAQIDGDLVNDFANAAIAHQVPADALMAIAEHDSGFDQFSRSRGPGDKTRGIIKMSDRDVAENKGSNPYIPAHAIDVAARKMRGFLDSGMSVPDAVKATKFGPDKDQWGPEAEDYANGILSRSQHFADTYFPEPAPQPAPAPAAPPPATFGDNARDAALNVALGVNMGVQDLNELSHKLMPKFAADFVDWADKSIGGKTMEERGKEISDHLMEKLSPQMRSASQKKWWDGDKGALGDAWGDWRAYMGPILQSLPETVLTSGPAMRLAQVSFAKAIAKGVPAAEAAARAATIAGVGGAVSEGALGGAQSAREVRDEIEKIPLETLQKSDAFNALKQTGMSDEAAKQALARDLGTRAFVTGGIVTGAFGGMGDRIITDTFLKNIGKSGGAKGLAANLAKSAAGEGLAEELPQSALQQLAQNEAVQKADPNKQLMDDVVNQALGGAVTGAAMGAGMGGAFHGATHNMDTTPPEPPRDPSAMGYTPPPPGSVSAAAMEQNGPLMMNQPGETSAEAMRRDFGPGAVAGRNTPPQMLERPGTVSTDAMQRDFAPGAESARAMRQLTGGGPLARILEERAPDAAAAADVVGKRVVVTDESGDHVGHVIGQDADGILVKDEGGGEQLVSHEEISSGQTKIAEVPAAATQEAPKAEEPKPEPRRPTEQSVGDEAIAKSPTAPAPRAQERSLAEMSEAELRERLKFIASQAKAGKGWTKPLMVERRKVETEIEARSGAQTEAPKAVEPASAPVTDEKRAKAVEYAKRNWWGARPAAEAFIENNGIGDTYEVKQDGRKFSAVPKAENGFVQFDKDSGTLGVPRAEMPQVAAEHHGALTNFLNAKGIDHETKEVPADELKPTQAEFSPEKVEKAKDSEGDRSVIVSNDGHVIDGHHQWLAAKDEGEPVKAIVLDAPVEKALEAVKEFPSATTSQESAPAGDVAKGKWFGTREKAEAFIEKKGLGGTHEIKQSGKFKFEVAPKSANVEAESVVAPQGYQVDPATTLNEREAQLKGGKFIAVARRLAPWSVEAGYGDTKEEAQRDALRRVGASADVDRQKAVEAGKELLGKKIDLTPPIVTQLNDDAGRYTVSSGAQLYSTSGRALSAAPKADVSTPRKRTATLDRQNQWLVDEARKEAQARGDAWIGNTILKSMNPDNLSMSDRDMLNDYLFGSVSGPSEINFKPSAPQPAQKVESAPEKAPEPQKPSEKPLGSDNTIFTKEAYEAARKRFTDRHKGQFNSGIDPADIIDGLTLAGFHIEAGARAFSDFAKAMVSDLGDNIRPYLKSWYLGVKFDPRSTSLEGMTSAAEVEAADIDKILAKDDANEPSKLDQSGQKPLEGVPAEEVRGTEADRGAGKRAEEGGRADEPRNERAGEPGLQGARSLGDGEGAVSVPAGGKTERSAGGERGREAVQSDRAGEEPDAEGRGGVEPSSGSTAQDRPSDFAITDEDRIGEGGQKTKFRQNIDAIRLLRQLKADDRPATRAEQATLAKWVGWGGLPQAFERSDGSTSKGWEKEVAELRDLLSPEELKAAAASTRNAHYTSPEIVKGMWSALRRLGFDRGRVLEPSVGVGNFFGLMPADMRSASALHGVELDTITGGIAKQLYPAAKIVAPMGFQNFTIPDGYFDAVIGNPPFGSEKLYDPNRKDLSSFSIHNYFFAKSLDGLRPGGVMAMVVTNRMMDARSDEARQYLRDRADLVAAIRLPNDAFAKNAGTEVTTDIVILRKRADGEAPSGHPWGRTLVHKDKNGVSVPINEYFAAHPENMLGEFGDFGTMYAARARGEVDPALIPREGQDTAKLLAEAIERLPRNIMTGSDVQPALEAIPIKANLSHVRVGSMFVQDGKAFVREEDQLGEPRGKAVEFPNERAEARVLGMLSVRDHFADLRRLQLDPTADDRRIEAARDRLNSVYDVFKGEHGYINSDANKRLFRDDPSWPQISALEEGYDKGVSAAIAKTTGEKPRGPSASKAAVFSRRTQAPYSPPVTAKSAKDALVSSLSERGRVDLDYMSKLYDKPQDQVLKELGDLVFNDPVRGLVTREEYLSGNVKQKLAEARDKARSDGDFERNVAALEQVQPKDIAAADISVKPGAHWLPREDMRAFVQHMTGARNADAFYNPASGRWTISGVASDDASVKWGTSRARVADIVEAAASQKSMVIRDKTEDDKYVVNEAETEAANAKVQAVKDEWERWIFDDDDRRDRLSRIYNDMFNTNVQRTFDGSHLTFPGKIGDDIISLRPHQKNAIWRILQSGTTLLDHVVGAGKTFTIVGAVMEGRRMGLMKKPMLIVPNHLVEQWAADFIRLYPSANILAATKKDFEKENRKRLFARIATGDWDAVIVAHSSFGRVEVEPEAQIAFIEKQVADLVKTQEEVRSAEGKEGRNVKQIQEQIQKKTEKMKKLLDTGRKDDALYWGELGVDGLFVDEAHEFKNLEYSTSMQRVAGLGNQQGSQKASDLYLKVDQVLQATGGRNVTFATGTPISNTMAEMFTMQRYLDGKTLEQQGLSHFDAWARMYGEIVSSFEISPAGKYKLNSRFAKFTNLPELMQSYTSFADVIGLNDIRAQLAEQGKRLPVPRVKGGKPQNIVVDRSQDQAGYIGQPIVKPGTNEESDEYPNGSLIWRADHLPKRPEKGADNMLKVMSDARKAALDMRLIDPSYPDYAGSKVNEAAKSIKQIYDKWHADKGTQLVFIDLSTPKNAQAKEARAIRELMDQAEAGDEAAQEKLDNMSPDEMLALDSKFSVYDDLKDKLIARGIPADEIAFIHDANTDQQKSDLFAKVRSGRIRVFFGSTAKMGAGTNVQNRLVALHHLDAPWRPSDLEQREGRIIRQGNELFARDPDNFEVEINRYATKQTLDSRMWQTIESKANFIEQIRKGTGERSVEDVAGEAMNSAEMKAAASGNPLVFDEMELRQKVRKLTNEEYAHRQDQYRVRDAIKYNESSNKHDSKFLADMIADRTTERPEKFEVKIRGEVFDKRREAGERILDEAKALDDAGGNAVKIGSYGGFGLTLARVSAPKSYVLVASAKGEYESSVFNLNSADAQGVAQRIINMLPNETEIYKTERQIESRARMVENMKGQVGEWTKRAELDETKAKWNEVIGKLKHKKPAEPKASIGAEPGNMTAADLRDHLVRGKDGPLIQKLLSSGRIVLHDTAEQLPGSAPANAQGMTTADGTIHLAAGNLTPETARAVLLHEAFHAGAEALTGARGWKSLMERVQTAVDNAMARGDGEGFWADAIEQARASGGRLAEEAAAYAVENYERAPAGIKDVVDRLIGLAKAWAVRAFGRQFGSVTPAQLRALAVSALRSVTDSPEPTIPGPGGSRYSIASPKDIAADAHGLFKKAADAASDFLTSVMVGAKGSTDQVGKFSALALVPTRPLFLELAKGLPSAKHYISTKQAMDQFRNTLAEEADGLLQKWFSYARNNKEENTALMDLMHESTIAQADPSKEWSGQEGMTPADRDDMRRFRPGSERYEAALKKQNEDAARKAAWGELKTRYDAMSDVSKQLYNDVRDAYEKRADESEAEVIANVQKALDRTVRRAEQIHSDEMQRITDEGLVGRERDAAKDAADLALAKARTVARRNRAARIKKMREMFEANRLTGPYFPLARFGNYFVTVRDGEGKVISFSRFESRGEQRKFAEEMEKTPGYRVEQGLATVKSEVERALDPKFVAEVDALLEGAGAPDDLRDKIWQKYLETLPDLSIRKNRIHRKNRLGFDTDALRAFANNMFHSGHQLARLRYGMELQEHIDSAGREVKEADDPIRAGAVYNEMVRAHDFAMNPQGEPWAYRLSSFAFMWTMAFNLSSAIVNLDQAWTKGIPNLAYDEETNAGLRRAASENARALRDVLVGRGFIENASTLTDDERKAIRAGYDLGVIDKTQAHDLANVAESGIDYNPIRHNIMKAASAPMHHTERLNREVTFMAAYRIAKAAGLSQEKSIAKAADLTWMTHFDNQSSSKPRIMRSDIGRAAFALKAFQANILFRLFRDMHQTLRGADAETRKAAIGRIASTMLLTAGAAGVRGAYFYSLVMMMAGAFLGGDDPDEELRKWVLEHTGDTMVGRAVGGMIMDGAPGYITGTALSDRLGLADLWFRANNRELNADQQWASWLEQLGGAPLSLLHQVYQGGSEIVKGNIVRGVEKMAPAAVRNIAKAGRYAVEGVQDKNGNPVVENVPIQDVIKQAIGFTPAEISDQYARNTFQTNTQTRIHGEKSAALRAAGRARLSGDQDAIAAAQKKVDAYNAEVPEARITPKSIMQEAKRFRKKHDRMELGVDLDPKLEDRIKEETAPSIYRR
ncbi:PLxRFG domain-containing protein [Methylosinus sp. PW1]|uniref:PLxRFG domain-containing protein n=1 Tax=Methylosinus sp. PW1 TaxID=107636 RepID=UPI00068E6934|nr:PLxRFG domain-containing protein [Methylosinus sp. PW1]